MANPTLEVRPDFASEAFRAVCEALMQGTAENEQQVMERLVAAWDADHDHRVEDWNLQREEEEREARHHEDEHREMEEAERQAQEADAERERNEAEKKKPKISDFDENRPPPSIIAPHPSQYAINKLASNEFVELWYFTPDGCAEATCLNRSQADDALGLSALNDILTLHPVASVKASRNACADHDLSFHEFLLARNSFLRHVKDAKWPDKHANALALFFWNLENHPMRSLNHGDKIVLLYASRVCHLWHDDFKNNPDSAFNISLINDNLMNSISFEVSSSIQSHIVRKVSLLSPSHPPSPLLTHILSPLTFSSSPSHPSFSHMVDPIPHTPIPLPAPRRSRRWLTARAPPHLTPAVLVVSKHSALARPNAADPRDPPLLVVFAPHPNNPLPPHCPPNHPHPHPPIPLPPAPLSNPPRELHG